ncbi:anhydro-N-acetylmuramic acid kinase [Allomuricauda sp. ARW1Y1]|jgi:anhydro-N-acetylmuramic acid kinase|uniref:anhydro-N-acetylmuramic acid kinase n=1 Tax=Allomuricauda sp. ARW1Y1 TaxID=2663843 RepID=UPI0015C8938E|nr:anhydro-N-acetylmuramic acid kinase [Muricauda sp. ARW1Y1]NYJ28659.1 anhydro-N-acetylmuramic acid kinase [Muricauda sp. ARW1Y1]
MKIFKVIGLMSGTSLDGLDIAYCHIWRTGDKWDFEIKKTKGIPYDNGLKEQLRKSIYLTASELLAFDVKYGIWLGERVKDFIQSEGIEVDFIANHGHTSHHRPELGFTHQLGSGQYLANTAGHKVICDFRNKDISLGGQGAPLVPIGDSHFFHAYDFCLNLGGISNISFEHKGHRIAYDIGLANMVLNHITAKIGLPYDDGGQLAQKGTLIPELLRDLNALAYYRQPFPKSTGFEWFMEQVVPILDNYDNDTADLLHTCIHHISEQIAVQVNSNCSKREAGMLVTGGGAINSYLMRVLQEQLGAKVKLVIPPEEIIAFKEALVFALMGVLKMVHETNVLGSVTGASKDSSSGIIYEPK